jgi:hypothetical protein
MDEVLLAKSVTLERCLRRIAEKFSQILEAVVKVLHGQLRGPGQPLHQQS